MVNSTNTTTSPLWLRFGACASLIAAIAFLFISLFQNLALARPPALVETSIVVVLAIAVSLTSYSLVRIRSVHRATLQAYHDTDCEFSSIFQHVLDGILIVDNDGVCLDANPAAAAILRVGFGELIDEKIDRFLTHQDAFWNGWNSFLKGKRLRGRARLTAADGATLFVEFTAAAHYLPGRHAVILCDVTKRTHAEISLKKSEERFQHMANNIQEIFWMIDAETLRVIYVNPAYATITGYSLESLQANPLSYRELIHPEDRVRVISRLGEAVFSGCFDEEFRFTRADGTIRWIWAKGFPVPCEGETQWLVGTAQDITSRKQAEMKIAEQLDVVEAACAEAEALRKATLALSQNLAMDSVLDTLLHCISDLVPFDRATVLFVEEAAELMIAREAPHTAANRMGRTFKASENVFLQRLLFEKQAVLLVDTSGQTEWRDVVPFERLQSWLGVPLIAGGNVLGILSLGANRPSTFTMEHFRLAKSLSVPAAVAIQNARIHERAAIYAAELEMRLRSGCIGPDITG